MCKGRILVVEDEKIIALDIRQSLEHLGFEVVDTVATGEAAIQVALTAQPDLALMDIHLRGEMDGIQAAEIIQSRYHLPIIFLTAFADPDTLKRAQSTEAFGYLLKPFEDRELSINIEMALDKHRSERALQASNDELEQRVRERTQELDEVNQALQRTVKTLEAQVAERTAILVELYQDAESVNARLTHTNQLLETANQRLAHELLERKQLEAALRKSEQLYRSLVDLSPDSITLTDLNGKIQVCSQQTAHQNGYPSPEAMTGLSILDCFIPEDRPLAADAMRQALEQGGIYSHEFTLLRPDGSTLPVEISASILRDSVDGHVKGYLGITRDISERKQAAEALVKRTRQLEVLRQVGMDLTAELDLDKLLHTIVERAVELLEGGAGSILLYQPERNCLEPGLMSGTPIYPPGTTIKPGQGVAGRVWESRQPLAINDYANWEGRLPYFDRILNMPVIGAPVLWREEFLGVLVISRHSSHGFGQDEVELLSLFAAQAASAIANARLFDRSFQRARELEALGQVSSVLRKANDLDEMQPILIDQAGKLFDADEVLFVLDRGEYLEVISHDCRDGQQQRQPVPREAMPDWQLPHPTDLAVLEESPWPEMFPSRQFGRAGHPPLHSCALVRLRAGDSTMGLLEIGYHDPHQYSDFERRLLLALADMVGTALQRAGVMETLEKRVAARTRELSVLFGVAALANGIIDLPQVLERSLADLSAVLGAPTGWVHLLSEERNQLRLAAHHGVEPGLLAKIRLRPADDALLQNVLNTHEPYLVPNLQTASALTADYRPEAGPDQSYLGVSIQVKGQVLGVVSLLRPSSRPFSPEEIALLGAVADQVGLAIESARLRSESERAAVMEERQRLARELHDSVTQSLYSLNLLAAGYRQSVRSAQPEEVEGWLLDLGQVAHQTLKEMRLLLYELRPATLEQDGLAEALRRRLESVEGRAGIKTSLQIDSSLLLPVEVTRELYGIAQEALNNALKHAAARSIVVRLRREQRRLWFEVQDDGAGFRLPDSDQAGGMGLFNLNERARRLNGSLEIESQPGHGTCVRFTMECPHAC